MKLSTETWMASGSWGLARSVSVCWVITRSASPGRAAMDLLVTYTSSRPAPESFLRSTEAPIAEEPIPASQAK